MQNRLNTPVTEVAAAETSVPMFAHKRAYKSFNTDARRSRALHALFITTSLIAASFTVAATTTSVRAEPVKVEGVQAPSFSKVVEAVSPAVVSVRVKSTSKPKGHGNRRWRRDRGDGFGDLPPDHPMRRFFERHPFGEEFGFESRPRRGSKPRRPRPASQGSGFFISGDGYIVTNNHVIDNGDEIAVVMNDGTEMDAKLIGADARTDLALLKVEPENDKEFTYVAFAQEDKSSVGDWVVAVGNPFGLGGTVTAGIISARGRDIGAGPYDDFIQIDAAVNRGNSGGPTFDTNGNVVGVNTAIFSPSGGNVGIAFAIPASTATDVIEELKTNGRVTRGWLGVQIQSVTDDIADSLGLEQANGALVSEAQADSPAEKSGLTAGDVIVAVNDETVESPKDLAKRIAGMSPGVETTITVWRKGKEVAIPVSLGTLPSKQSAVVTEKDEQPARSESEVLSEFGLALAENENGELIVEEVDRDSEAFERGLRRGDRIAAINGDEVGTVHDIQRAIEDARESGRGAVLIQLQREGRSQFITLPTKSG